MALPTPGVTPANWGAQLNEHIEARTYLRKMISGRYYRAPFATVAASWSGAALGDMSLTPFVCHTAGTIDRLAINITTAAAGATNRLGIYSTDADGQPDALLVDGGTVDASTTGAKEVTVSVAVTAGQVIWLTGVAQGALISQATAVSGASNPEYMVGGSSVATGDYPGFVVTGQTGALPATVTINTSTAPGIRAWVIYARLA